jgi:hypothetical protein
MFIISIFLILDFYFHATTHFLTNSILQFISLLLFFPLASYIAKLNRLSGLRGIGLIFNKSSYKYFTIRFFIGFFMDSYVSYLLENWKIRNYWD